MSNWRIEHDNDAGNDGGFWEWWDVTDGDRSFRVSSSEADAEWLKAALERAGDVPEAGDLSWEQRERTIAEGRMSGLPPELQLPLGERESVAGRAVGGAATALATAVRLVDETLRTLAPVVEGRLFLADGAPASMLTRAEKDALASRIVGDDPVSQVTAMAVINETLHAVAQRQEQPVAVAWRRRRYDAPNAPWVYRETPPEPNDPDALKLPYEPLFRKASHA